MYATEEQNRGSDCSLIVVSLTTENNRIIHIRKAVAFSDFMQTFCNLLYSGCRVSKVCRAECRLQRFAGRGVCRAECRLQRFAGRGVCRAECWLQRFNLQVEPEEFA